MASRLKPGQTRLYVLKWAKSVRIIKVTIIKHLIGILAISISLYAVAENEEKIDYLALAGLLIQDKNYDKASNALAKVNEADEGLDKPRFYTLRGLINLNTELYDNAVKDFNTAILSGQKEKFIHLYLAQAYFYLEQFQLVIIELNRSGELAAKTPVTYLMRSQAHWKLQQHELAWSALDQGEIKFPEKGLFHRQKVFMLMELGLYQQAVETGNLYLTKFSATALDYVAIGSSLLKAGQYDDALIFLEKAALLFPKNEKTKLALAHAYVSKKELNVAADIMQDVATQNSQYVTDASELYRRAGRNHKALSLAMYASNQKNKLKQRLAIYLQAGLIDNIKAMEDDLERSGLLKNDDVIYAMAYALFRSGRFESAEDYLSKIKKGDTFRKAMSLRKAMNDCQLSRWKCY